MIKVVLEKNVWERKPRKVNRIFCDGCGRLLEWAAAHPSGMHFCEKCLTELKEKQSEVKE